MTQVMTVVELKLSHRAFDVRHPDSRTMMFMDRSHKFNTPIGPHVIPDPEETIPVEYRRAERFNRWVDDGHGGKTVESFWVLWTPEIEKLIGVPLSVVDSQQQRIGELHKEIEVANQKAASSEARIGKLYGDLARFARLPWYRRAWRAMIGDII